MNIIAVDDERHALNLLEKAIADSVNDARIQGFSSAKDALEFARENHVDVAFLDIEMVDMNGLALAKRLKDIHGETNIIFVTAHPSYGIDAFKLHASGYVIKPVNRRQVAEELRNLRNPIEPDSQGVSIRCFGSFEVFVDGRPVVFGRPKAKELLAYLVDRRGSVVSKKELAVVLWEKDDYSHSTQSHLYVLISDMVRTLEEAGAEDIIIKKRGAYAIDPSRVHCDYFEYEKGNAAAVNSYRGEYMVNYSWAEFTAGILTSRMHKAQG